MIICSGVCIKYTMKIISNNACLYVFNIRVVKPSAGNFSTVNIIFRININNASTNYSSNQCY